jgi:hypothetical protein
LPVNEVGDVLVFLTVEHERITDVIFSLFCDTTDCAKSRALREFERVLGKATIRDAALEDPKPYQMKVVTFGRRPVVITWRNMDGNGAIVCLGKCFRG